MGGWNRIASAGLLKPLAGVPFAFMPGAGAAYFLVGSALGSFAMPHASDSEIGREWASAAHWVALSRSVGAHHLLVAMSLLLLAAKFWRLGKLCDAVDGLVGTAGATVQAVRVRAVVRSSEVNGAEEGNVERLRRRLVRERRLKEAALEELEKERRAAASAANEAMAMVACLLNEKALVEREARQFREMVQQKEMYEEQVIEGIIHMLSR